MNSSKIAKKWASGFIKTAQPISKIFGIRLVSFWTILSLLYIGNVFFLIYLQVVQGMRALQNRVISIYNSFFLSFVCRDCLWLHQTVLISFWISFLLINEWYKTVYLFWRFRAEFRHASTDKAVISVYRFSYRHVPMQHHLWKHRKKSFRLY